MCRSYRHHCPVCWALAVILYVLVVLNVPILTPVENLPQADHREGVEAAVGEELSLDFLFTFRRSLGMDGFSKYVHRLAAILHSLHVSVTEIRTYGGQNGFYAPRAVLAWMVVPVPRNREQIHDSRKQTFQWLREFWKALRRIRDDHLFESGVEYENRPLGPAGRDECLGKGSGGILAGKIEQCRML